jgi:hypothetical protein
MILTATTDESTLTQALRTLARHEPPEAVKLAKHIRNKTVDKWDDALDESLLELNCAHRDLDVEGAWKELAQLTGT